MQSLPIGGSESVDIQKAVCISHFLTDLMILTYFKQSLSQFSSQSVKIGAEIQKKKERLK